MAYEYYKLLHEEGKHLADSHGTQGTQRGVYLDDETNKPSGAGEFLHMSFEEILDENGFSSAGNAWVFVGVGLVVGALVNEAAPHVITWAKTKALPKAKRIIDSIKGKKAKEPENILEIPFEDIYSEDLESEDQNNVEVDQEETPKTDTPLSETRFHIA